MNETATKLIGGEIDILQAMYLVRPNAKGELKTFIDNEIDGYNRSGGLPDYRIFNCAIVLDYRTPWGDIHREVELDASLLTKKIGYDVNQVLIFDNIDFIQNSIAALGGSAGIRPFNSQMVEMLAKVVVPSHPGSKVIGGGFKFQKQQLQSILDNVKRILIKMLQDHTPAPLDKEVGPQTEENITIFVSYAWENEEQNTKVVSFVDFLIKNGYDARMDKSESQKETAINFKKMMHEGVYNSDKVIIVLSEKYKKKADQLEDGVGEEIKIIQEEISRINNKYILVSFHSLTKDLLSKIVPIVLVDREVIDLKRDQDENQFTLLFSKLEATQIIAFSEIARTKPIIKPKEIPPFKL
ncbi:MAG: TIR domain-containing protein [Bacteroidetes bacterium]|nr:TIR domain-containing protein [Bacteroidota bacterium]